ncbi:putative acetyltransferase [Ferrimonas sediminum]|uniref:Putative acetyltransferase n=1 Tax=Ferrimonas sediminum TaxID=718193 RepID=A0A1G8NAZ1_9GAMM|nr:N-acetyltransferase [Ferrimonas sediminum]SDI77256.1 putative acetyltransferase [Ferrimonas sediminum]
MQIRVEQIGDSEAIGRITYEAFLNHPHHEPGAQPTEHLIVERLRGQGALVLSLVALEQERVVGHIAVSPVTIDGEDLGWVGLAPVSVTPNSQGQGIGSALVNEAILRLSTQGVNGVVLVGDPAYYGRFGFVAESSLTYPGVPAQYFMARSLKGSVPCGEVAYHPAFG